MTNALSNHEGAVDYNAVELATRCCNELISARTGRATVLLRVPPCMRSGVAYVCILAGRMEVRCLEGLRLYLPWVKVLAGSVGVAGRAGVAGRVGVSGKV